MTRFRLILVVATAAAVASMTGSLPVVRAAVNAPVLKWGNAGCVPFCETGWYSSPAVADLDGDGAPEVIWGAYKVVVLNGATGATRATATNSSRVWPGVAVTDLTGDGTLEIVVARAANQLHAYRFQAPSTLSVAWSANPFSTFCASNNCEVRTLAVADLESDGQRDVIVGRATGGATEQLNAFNGSGVQRTGWPALHVGDPGYGWGMYNQNVTVADMNRDGFKEVFGPTDTHYIMAFDRNGSQLPVAAGVFPPTRTYWSEVGVHVDHAVDVRGYAFCGTEHRPNFADSAPAVADVNGDGVPEMIVVGNVYNCDGAYTSLYRMPFIFKLDRTRWSGSGFDWTAIPAPGPGSAPPLDAENYAVIESALSNPAIADLDGDGFMEILYASYDGKVHAYSLDKTEKGSWPYVVPTLGLPGDTFRFASEPVVADLDNDGRAEVLFASWPKKGIGAKGQLHILNHLGQELHRIDLPNGTNNGGLAAPTIANIDSDADLELVVGTISSGVAAYDLPGSAAGRVLWGTGRGGILRSGSIPSAVRRAPNFDNDLRADATVYHPGSGLWYARRSTNGTTFSVQNGGQGYQPVEGDFDGDGPTDAAVYQAASGLWFVRQSSTGTTFSYGFGGPGYAAVPRDFDGDGVTDFAAFHAGTGLWYIRSSRTGTTSSTGFGGNGYAPVPADYDGDGRADLAVIQEASGLWFIRSSATGRTTTVAFGGSGYTPLPRDYDGDGRADIAVYHGPTGLWYVRQSSADTTLAVGYGGPGYSPVPADFDGDRRADLTVYHAASGLWFVRQSSTGTTLSFGFGGSAFTPVSE
jgi:hypothetical protein